MNFRNMLSGFMPQQNQPQAPGVPPRVDPSGGKRVPKRSWQDKAYIIGAGLQDMGGGQGNLDAARKMFAERGEQERIGQIRDNLPLEQRALFDVSREAWARSYGMPQAAPEMQFINRGRGAYDITDPRTGEVVRSQGPFEAAPGPVERPRELGPDGIYELQDDGEWKKVANFGAAPKVFAPPRVGGNRGGAAGVSAGGLSDMSTEDLLRALEGQ